jgi:polyisoprenoid-binding protein YceI
MSIPTTWAVDQSHTVVEFAVRHLMIATTKGRFGEVQGTVTLDLDNPARGALDISIAAASVDTGHADRDAHLRSADFLAAERFPAITYRSRRIEPAGDDAWQVIGDLTIRGVTREVPLAVTLGGVANDPWGNQRAAFSGSTTINRRDFGLTWNQLLETGGVLVGDEVKVALDVELIRQGALAAA